MVQLGRKRKFTANKVDITLQPLAKHPRKDDEEPIDMDPAEEWAQPIKVYPWYAQGMVWTLQKMRANLGGLSSLQQGWQGTTATPCL